jgi:hypothetical protein
MYDYRILFPRIGEREIRRELEAGREDLARIRRPTEDCLRAGRRTRRGRP